MSGSYARGFSVPNLIFGDKAQVVKNKKSLKSLNFTCYSMQTVWRYLDSLSDYNL